MNNFGAYVTPEEYVDEFGEKEHTLEELRRIANRPDTPCIVCEGENAWKLGQSGMCFSCTTGEADAGEDLELAPSEDYEE